mmetsp:Transcript_3383/g.7968  ORF Transcript_3383/g.7968 Transcript_3383/m.7968 type:complete len:801 (-) Transcript_3383:80-2482(-)
MADIDEKTILESFEGLEGMNLPVAQFVQIFKTNPYLVRKVAMATGFEEQALRCVPEEELLVAFAQWDTDSTGTISFDNFVQGLSQMRHFSKALQDEAAHEEEQSILRDSVMKAKDAFDIAKGGKTELSLQDFMEALSDDHQLQRISAATELPLSWFESLTARGLLDLFKEVDLDCSGTISLDEWVEALVQIRLSSYHERKAEEKEAMDAVRKYAEAALDEGDEDWNGEFDLREFFTAFKYNARFLRKVSLATGIPVEEFRQMQAESIEELFMALDTDYSGTVSFAEFVKGLAEIRLIRKKSIEEHIAAQEASVMNRAVMAAHEAFQMADLSVHGELDLHTFLQALTDPNVAAKVSQATSVPVEWFLRLDAGQIVDLFRDIDTDANGSISFKEWIAALLRVRHRNFEDDKEVRQKEALSVERLAEEALEDADLDMSGELDFREFIAAFRSNPRFVRKVAVATNISVDELTSLEVEDLDTFFTTLDLDGNGTISFEEFANGLLEVRMKQQAYALEQAEAENQAVVDVAYLDALDAFSEANLGATGELDLDSFHKALQEPAVLEKVAWATNLSVDFFSDLTKNDIKELFAGMDFDASGTVSFNEWVEALVNTRQEVYSKAKLEQEQAMEAVIQDAMAAMDEVQEDWSSELHLDRFISAFQTNDAFLRKVSHATGISMHEYRHLQARDLQDLFAALDMDLSGTVSFDEFVQGLAAIRLAHDADVKAQAYEEANAEPEPARVVKDVMASNMPQGVDAIQPDDLRELLMLLDKTRWTADKLEKLVLGLPWGRDGSLPLGVLIDFLY